eukprot:gene9063-10002_t
MKDTSQVRPSDSHVTERIAPAKIHDIYWLGLTIVIGGQITSWNAANIRKKKVSALRSSSLSFVKKLFFSSSGQQLAPNKTSHSASKMVNSRKLLDNQVHPSAENGIDAGVSGQSDSIRSKITEVPGLALLRTSFQAPSSDDEAIGQKDLSSPYYGIRASAAIRQGRLLDNIEEVRSAHLVADDQ